MFRLEIMENWKTNKTNQTNQNNVLQNHFLEYNSKINSNH